jgi:hypothetical protein
MAAHQLICAEGLSEPISHCADRATVNEVRKA